jgi:hypothetical protein
MSAIKMNTTNDFLVIGVAFAGVNIRLPKVYLEVYVAEAVEHLDGVR